MVLIGLLLIAAAVAAAIILVVQNDGTITVHVFDADYRVAAYWLAIAGLAIMAVLALGLWALRVGAAHRMRLRRERRELLRENRLLSERAASVPDAAGNPGRVGSVTGSGAAGSSAAGSDAAGAHAYSDGAHAEPVRTRTDEPGRMPPADA
jgi:membrane protein implicated in regulation of membrane protease activity